MFNFNEPIIAGLSFTNDPLLTMLVAGVAVLMFLIIYFKSEVI